MRETAADRLAADRDAVVDEAIVRGAHGEAEDGLAAAGAGAAGVAVELVRVEQVARLDDRRDGHTAARLVVAAEALARREVEAAAEATEESPDTTLPSNTLSVISSEHVLVTYAPPPWLSASLPAKSLPSSVSVEAAST